VGSCGSRCGNLHKVVNGLLRYLQQISVKFVEILKCEHEFLVLGSDSQRGVHM
jgi:hypothetical protein